ncbi:hypothetical protein AKJ16_DCAP12770 [Drosera capensis]
MLRLRAFQPTNEKIVKIQLHPKNPWLVTADASDHVSVWNWEHRQVIYELKAGGVDERRLFGVKLEKLAEGESEAVKGKPTEAIKGSTSTSSSLDSSEATLPLPPTDSNQASESDGPVLVDSSEASAPSEAADSSEANAAPPTDAEQPTSDAKAPEPGVARTEAATIEISSASLITGVELPSAPLPVHQVRLSGVAATRMIPISTPLPDEFI